MVKMSGSLRISVWLALACVSLVTCTMVREVIPGLRHRFGLRCVFLFSDLKIELRFSVDLYRVVCVSALASLEV